MLRFLGNGLTTREPWVCAAVFYGSKAAKALLLCIPPAAMVMAFQILFVFILAAANAMRTTEPSAVSAGPETSAYNEVVIPKASELFYTGLPYENGISEYVLLRLELVRNHNNRICKCLGPRIIAVKACSGLLCQVLRVEK